VGIEGRAIPTRNVWFARRCRTTKNISTVDRQRGNRDALHGSQRAWR